MFPSVSDRYERSYLLYISFFNPLIIDRRTSFINQDFMISKSKSFVAFVGLILVACTQLAAQTPHKTSSPPIRRVSPTRVVTARDTLRGRNLLADGYNMTTAREAETRISDAEMERALEREALEYPAIDLYGEDSWTNWVNPFAGKSSPRVPATYDIDCSGFVMPLEGTMRVTSNYGYRARYRREHKGIDLALRTGDDVRAAFDGKVRIRGYERGGYGNYIVIRHPNGLETVYGHMSRCIAQEGQIVRAGEVIGKGGSTGRSTGPHLHFETRFLGIDINPARIIDFSVGAPQSDFYTFVAPRGYKTYAYDDNDAQSKASSDSKYKAKAKKNRASASRAPRIYRVKKGDTLSSIAKKTGISVSRLCKANNMSSRAVLRPGQSLKY